MSFGNCSNLVQNESNSQSGLHVPRGKLWHELKNQNNTLTSGSDSLIYLSSDDEEYLDINGNRTVNDSNAKPNRVPNHHADKTSKKRIVVQKGAPSAVREDDNFLVQCSSKSSINEAQNSSGKSKKRSKKSKRSMKIDSCSSIEATKKNKRKIKCRTKKAKSKAKKAKSEDDSSTIAEKNSAVESGSLASLSSKNAKKALSHINNAESETVKELGTPEDIRDGSKVRRKALAGILDKQGKHNISINNIKAN